MKISLNRRTLAISSAALVVVVVAVVLAVVLTSSGPSKGNSSGQVLPVTVYPGPANTIGGTTPNAQGLGWVLVNDGAVANAQLINLQDGNKEAAFGVSRNAKSIATSSTGRICLGMNTGTTGYVEFFNPQGFKEIGVVPTSGGVLDVVAGSDGTTFYALQDVRGADSVVVINSKTLKITSTVPMPSTTLSIAVSPDETLIYSLQANGHITLVDEQTGSIEGALPAAAGGRQIALSVDGATLYVLKGALNDDNVSVIDVATESTVAVLPAPANTQQVQPSLDGSRLIDYIGSASVGNIQIFDTNR